MLNQLNNQMSIQRSQIERKEGQQQQTKQIQEEKMSPQQYEKKESQQNEKKRQQQLNEAQQKKERPCKFILSLNEVIQSIFCKPIAEIDHNHVHFQMRQVVVNSSQYLQQQHIKKPEQIGVQLIQHNKNIDDEHDKIQNRQKPKQLSISAIAKLFCLHFTEAQFQNDVKTSSGEVSKQKDQNGQNKSVKEQNNAKMVISYKHVQGERLTVDELIILYEIKKKIDREIFKLGQERHSNDTLNAKYVVEYKRLRVNTRRVRNLLEQPLKMNPFQKLLQFINNSCLLKDKHSNQIKNNQPLEQKYDKQAINSSSKIDTSQALLVDLNYYLRQKQKNTYYLKELVYTLEMKEKELQIVQGEK